MFNELYQGNHLVQKPAGVSDFLPEQVKLYRSLEDQALSIFNAWGYEEVFVPTLEYPEMFAIDKGKFFEREMFKLSDETGRPMVIRPDFTPSIARLVATYYAQKPTPIRLCYSGKIYRSRLTSSSTAQGKEFYQMGAELIGGGVPDGDAEIAAIAAETMAAFGINDFVICMGDLAFIDRFLKELEIPESQVQNIKETLNQGNLVKFYQLIDGLALNDKNRRILKRLPRFRGKREDLSDLRETLTSLQVDDILTKMDNIYQVLEGYGLSDKVTFDLSLVRNLDYYTGFVFEGYASGIGYPLCGGGRYDNLMNYYGMNLSATGFGFSLDNILKLVSRKKQPAVETPTRYLVTYEHGYRKEALLRARKLRQKGYQVIMALASSTLHDALKYARKQYAGRLDYMTREGLKSYLVEEETGKSVRESEVAQDDQPGDA